MFNIVLFLIIVLLSSGCKSLDTFNELIVVNKKSIIISEEKRILIAPRYLAVENDTFFLISENRGTVIGRYNLNSGHLVNEFNLESDLEFGSNLFMNNYQLILEENPEIYLVNLKCDLKGNCYAGFYINLLTIKDDYTGKNPIAFITKINFEYLDNPLLVPHPIFSPINEENNMWVGLDMGFIVKDDILLATNAENVTSNQYKKLFHKYSLNGEKVNFIRSLDLFPSRFWIENEYPFILNDFYQMDTLIFHSDRKRILNLSNEEIIFDEILLEDDEIIEQFSIYDNFIFLLIAKRIPQGFSYYVNVYDMQNRKTIKTEYLEINSERLITYLFRENSLYFLTKGDNVKLNKYEFNFK